MQLDRGYLIVLEGIDGTGKSTHTEKLQEALMAIGYPVLRLFEPTKVRGELKSVKFLQKDEEM